MSTNVGIDIDAVVAGQSRLGPEEAIKLYREASLHDLGEWASAVCRRLHGERVRSYVIDRNINYTNVCSAHCTFCAFRRDKDDEGAYLLGTERLLEKVRELVAIGGNQILIQGGMHPDLGIDYYEQLLRDLKSQFPFVHIHGFSPPELVEFVGVFELAGYPTPGPGRAGELGLDMFRAKLRAILERLMSSGLDSIPGGGAEILVDSVRQRISPGKATTNQWLEVMSIAHQLGMFTSATMMFGHVEGLADHIMHLDRVRRCQDEAIVNNWPGRYVSFICWPFQRENTVLGRLPDWDALSGERFAGDVLARQVMNGEVTEDDLETCRNASPPAGRILRTATGLDYLRLLAISRLYLDNIPAIGSSWVTMGPKIGKLALSFGANDMGSVMMEENVVASAGTSYCLTEPFLCHLIRQAGFIPARRDNRYRLLQVHDGDDAPDLTVEDWSAHRVGCLRREVTGATT